MKSLKNQLLQLASFVLFCQANMANSASFTAKDLLSEPRRSPAVPNSKGTKALFSETVYSFETHSRSKKFNLLDTSSGDVTTILNDTSISEVLWLGVEDQVAYVQPSDEEVKGGSELWVLKGSDKYKAASFPASVSNLKFAKAQDGSITFLFTALAYPNGTIYNPETAPKQYSSGLVYTSNYVRHWDTLVKPEKSAVFSGILSLKQEGEYAASSDKYTNLLADSRLESPIPPFGDVTDFDITPDGSLVAINAKDPDLDPSRHTATYIYLVPASGDKHPKPLNKPTSDKAPAGASSSPAFSPDGKRLAFLQMDKDGYESDKRKIYIADVATGKITNLVPEWDRSPSKIVWSNNGQYLYLIGEEYGRDKVWILPSSKSQSQREKLPTLVVENGSTSDLRTLGEKSSDDDIDNLLVTSTSLVSPTYYSVFDAKSRKLRTIFSQRKVSSKGSSSLSESQVEEFWAPRRNSKTKVHGWIVKPTFFKEGEKYPIAFLIHGGPQGAWLNSWSTRWNPAVMAERGFVVVAVNPTGSTGYGQKFTDDIRNNWGGAPYEDLVLSFDYVLKNYKYLDGERAVALGASYGGYMVNWIQGMPFGRRFKALVCHDGVFSTLNQYASEELFFPEHDFGGRLWESPYYAKWSPSQHIANWQTPHMVIHNDLDYRLPISEGLAVFNVLQAKGVPSKFLTFPDENHWVLKPENSLVWHREVFEWIEKWVGIEDGKSKDKKEEPDVEQEAELKIKMRMQRLKV